MILLAVLIGLGCTRPLKFNEKKIRNKCDIADAVELTPDQALCVGRLAGLKYKRNCPLEVHEVVHGAAAQPAYDVRESCGRIGLRVIKADGRVVAVEVGDAVATDEPDRE